MYTTEMVQMMGEVYRDLLKVMNKYGHDPYNAISDRYPFKCIVMILPRAKSLGIPEELNRRIATLMDKIDLDDVQDMMERPMPMEYILAWQKGMNNAKKN